MNTPLARSPSSGMSKCGGSDGITRLASPTLSGFQSISGCCCPSITLDDRSTFIQHYLSPFCQYPRWTSASQFLPHSVTVPSNELFYDGGIGVTTVRSLLPLCCQECADVCDVNKDGTVLHSIRQHQLVQTMISSGFLMLSNGC